MPRDGSGWLGMPRDATGCHGMPQDVCVSQDATGGMPRDATRCHGMPRDATGCHQLGLKLSVLRRKRVFIRA
eukprot:7153578-Prymnesium_polylepis.1